MSALGAGIAGCNHNKSESVRLEEFLGKYIAANKIAGLVMIIAQNGKIIHHQAMGYSDIETKAPMEINANFRYSSLSKTFTHAAILRLFDQGKLHFEQNIRDFLPDFAPKMADGTIPLITISDLLSHSAGLNYGFVQESGANYRAAGISDGLDSSDISLAENLRRIAQIPLSFAPSKGWQYSVASDVLGAIIEKITGQKLSAAINNLINQPLALNSPVFHAAQGSMGAVYQSHENHLLKLTPQTTIAQDGLIINYDTTRIYKQNAFESGGAGMGGNAEDFIKLLEAIRSGDFIKPATRELAKQAIIPENTRYFKDGWGFGYLFSTLTDPHKAKLGFGKNSVCWGGVYGHLWLIDFANNLSFALLTNTALATMTGDFKRALLDNISQNFLSNQ